MAMTDEHEEFPCALCGTRYDDRGAALRCCSAAAIENHPKGVTDQAVHTAVSEFEVTD